MTDEELRRMVEDADEQMAPVLEAITTEEAGEFICPHCSADATWVRRGRSWEAGCTQCRWEAAGMLKAETVAS